jgi:hypothetical protein
MAQAIRYGTPRSEAFHLVDRCRLIDGQDARQAQVRHEKQDGRLGGAAGAMGIGPDPKIKEQQVLVMVGDPKVSTTPGSATARRGRGQWQELVYVENPVAACGKRTAIPMADGPDF